MKLFFADVFDPDFEQSEDLKIAQRRGIFSRDPHKVSRSRYSIPTYEVPECHKE